jgi:DNA repair exonuclease SbcCD ATPase subunit
LFKERYINDFAELKEIQQKIDSRMDVVKKYGELSKKLNEIQMQNNILETNDIPNLSMAIEKAKHQLVLFDQYRKDYNEYNQLYDKIEMVRQSVGINGIQAEIMDYTMNQILTMVNQLAAMMFGGRFTLDKFEITADDFLISFYDQETGQIRPDISMMSASQLGQLSMIISFVLLHNASDKFNIIRLDEVDNNLDNDNRLRFFSLVYTIMQILNFDQAVIISHNVELDLSNCDLIITRLQNVESYKALINSGANIIADFMRN